MELLTATSDNSHDRIRVHIIQDHNDPHKQLDGHNHHHLNGHEDQNQDHSRVYEDQDQEVDEDDYHSSRCEDQEQEIGNHLDEDQLLGNQDDHNSDNDNLVEDDETDAEENNSHNSGEDTCINDSELNREPLYNGTDLTAIASVCLIMQFALSNNLTNKAIEDLLKLLNHLLPFPTIYQKVITS